MAKFYIKETDSEIVLRVNADLTGSTVRVVVRSDATSVSEDLPCVITDHARGRITVDTSDVIIGTYDMEVEQNQGGKLFHYPNRGYDKLIAQADLDL